MPGTMNGPPGLGDRLVPQAQAESDKLPLEARDAAQDFHEANGLPLNPFLSPQTGSCAVI